MFQGAAHLTSHSSMKVSNKTNKHMYMYTLFNFIIVTGKTFHTYINLKLCLQTINIPCLVYDMYLSLFVSCHVRSSHYIRFSSLTFFQMKGTYVLQKQKHTACDNTHINQNTRREFKSLNKIFFYSNMMF